MTGPAASINSPRVTAHPPAFILSSSAPGSPERLRPRPRTSRRGHCVCIAVVPRWRTDVPGGGTARARRHRRVAFPPNGGADGPGPAPASLTRLTGRNCATHQGDPDVVVTFHRLVARGDRHPPIDEEEVPHGQ